MHRNDIQVNIDSTDTKTTSLAIEKLSPGDRVVADGDDELRQSRGYIVELRDVDSVVVEHPDMETATRRIYDPDHIVWHESGFVAGAEAAIRCFKCGARGLYCCWEQQRHVPCAQPIVKCRDCGLLPTEEYARVLHHIPGGSQESDCDSPNWPLADGPHEEILEIRDAAYQAIDARDDQLGETLTAYYSIDLLARACESADDTPTARLVGRAAIRDIAAAGTGLSARDMQNYFMDSVNGGGGA